MSKFPCSVCEKNVNTSHRAIQCDICDRWIHIKCNLLNSKDYENLKHSDEPFYCIKCIETNIAFSKLSNKEFVLSVINGVNGFSNETDIDFLSPTQMGTILNLNNFINTKMNSLSDVDEGDDDGTPPINCNYYDINEFTNAKFNA